MFLSENQTKPKQIKAKQSKPNPTQPEVEESEKERVLELSAIPHRIKLLFKQFTPAKSDDWKRV